MAVFKFLTAPAWAWFVPAYFGSTVAYRLDSLRFCSARTFRRSSSIFFLLVGSYFAKVCFLGLGLLHFCLDSDHHLAFGQIGGDFFIHFVH